jgi:hypothetical protein
VQTLASLVLAAVLVAAGIFAYDALAPAPGGPAPDATPDPPPRAPAPGAGADLAPLERRLEALERRAEAQEREIQAVREGRALPPAPAAAGVEGPSPAAPPGGYDEAALAAIEVHMEALRKRRIEQGLRQQMERALDHLAIPLADETRRQLVEAGTAFRIEILDLTTASAGRGEDPQSLAPEIDRRRRAASERLAPLVAPEHLESVSAALLGVPGIPVGVGPGTAPGR